MNLTINQLPPNWDPNNPDLFNKWIEKIYTHVGYKPTKNRKK